MTKKPTHIKLELNESVNTILHPYKVEPKPKKPEVKKDLEEKSDEKS